MENEKRVARLITLILGLLWLLDGILQLQPKMFTQAFVDTILSPNLQGQPVIIAHAITFGINIFKQNMLMANAFSAGIQVMIGFLLLLPLSQKWKNVGLWVFIPWALVVWVFGEGLGNLFTGSASFYTGAPGSVLLYLILALFLLFPKKLLFSYLPRIVGLLFFLGGLLNELPMFWTKGMQSMLYQMSQSDANGFIAFPAKILSHIMVSPSICNFIAISILVVLGILLLVKPTRLFGWIAIVFLFIVWWVSQDFGGIFTFPFGTATDPNSAPLFALFLMPLFFQQGSNKAKV